MTNVVMTGLWSVSRPALGMALESLMLHLILDLASVKSICDETSNVVPFVPGVDLSFSMLVECVGDNEIMLCTQF